MNRSKNLDNKMYSAFCACYTADSDIRWQAIVSEMIREIENFLRVISELQSSSGTS